MTVLGFIGIGVMGEPMCRNLAAKSGLAVRAYDIDPAPLERLAEAGVTAAPSVAAVGEAADVIFLSLPGGDQLQEVCAGAEGLLSRCRKGQTVVDMSTSPVGLTRDLAARFTTAGAAYADAPVTRTRQAARDGTLGIMVGAAAEVLSAVRPYLECMGTDVIHCGPVGCGQVVKQMNNMVLFQAVVALAEALTIARRAGVDGKVLFETLAKGSADSFALRNHGMKSLLPGVFPERAFSTDYARKDLSYALALAAEVGVEPQGAKTAAKLLDASRDAGNGAKYHPALITVIDPDAAR